MSDSDPCGLLKREFIPLAGNVYASRYFANIVYDEVALDLMDELDQAEECLDEYSEFDLLSYAVESMHMDQVTEQFLVDHYDGTLVELECGLDPFFQRNDNDHAQFIGVDDAQTLALREKYISIDEREIDLSCSIFDEKWINEVIKCSDGRSVLIHAFGVFQKYSYKEVVDLLRKLWVIPKVSILFDIESAPQRNEGFAIKDIDSFLKELSHFKLNTVSDFYEIVDDRKGMKAKTKLAMTLSDYNHSRQVLYLSGR